jgi:hypothetical protein
MILKTDLSNLYFSLQQFPHIATLGVELGAAIFVITDIFTAQCMEVQSVLRSPFPGNLFW